jgi:hypothetical protein
LLTDRYSWYVYRGDLRLLAFIGLGNVANLSFLSPAISGPEGYLARRPTLLVTVIFVQIVVTLVLVAALARRKAGSTTNGQSPRSEQHCSAAVTAERPPARR